MKINLLIILFFLGIVSAFAQTKVSGYVYDEYKEPVSFANVIFKGSSEGTITNENGKFYLESDETWSTVLVSFIGFETIEIPLEKKIR